MSEEKLVRRYKYSEKFTKRITLTKGIVQKKAVTCMCYSLRHVQNFLLLVYALVVSLWTCLATERTLSSWLRAALSCLCHVL